MAQTPDQLFRKVAGKVVKNSEWGFLSIDEATALCGHLHALKARKIGFTFFSPEKIIYTFREEPGTRTPHNTTSTGPAGEHIYFYGDGTGTKASGMSIQMCFKVERGNIWVESDQVHYTTSPTGEVGQHLESCRNMKEGLVKTIPREGNWVDAIIEDIAAQAIEAYGVEGFLLTLKPKAKVPA